VESAVSLTEAQQQALTDTLAGVIHKTPILVVRVKPELIGGLIVHIGDRVLDTSVRTRLQHIRTQLLARGSHEIQSGRDRFSHQ
jgi:F-type H+-transporting ATPase subunit delta